MQEGWLMLAGKTKTSLKIGGSVGIIILLLGVAVLFGIYQMSKVSQEISEISEEYVPLTEILSEISLQQSKQAQSFEKILRLSGNGIISEVQKSKELFWISSGSIESEISRGKEVAQRGIELTPIENDNSQYMVFFQKFVEIERIHNEYENTVASVFLILDSGQIQDAAVLLEKVDKLEAELQSQVDSGFKIISALTDYSTEQIESNERDSLIGQIIIVIMVGAIAATLGFFINQINKDLKKEVDSKTVELKSANEKLKELDRMKDEFIGIASHELKGPIQPIFGFAELARAGDIDQKEAWDGVTQLAKKLQDLANAVLDVSKIESNRLKLHFEKIPINDSIFEVVNEFKMNPNQRVTIQKNLDENIQIEVDKMRFEQVIRNLLNNSLKFTPEGTISISTIVFQDENKVVIRISDSGSGISEDILPKIFDKFVTKGVGSQSGTGLGLFLCKGILTAHGGEITAKNNPEKGATFELTLPISQKFKLQKVAKVFTN